MRTCFTLYSGRVFVCICAKNTPFQLLAEEQCASNGFSIVTCHWEQHVPHVPVRRHAHWPDWLLLAWWGCKWWCRASPPRRLACTWKHRDGMSHKHGRRNHDCITCSRHPTWDVGKWLNVWRYFSDRWAEARRTRPVSSNIIHTSHHVDKAAAWRERERSICSPVEADECRTGDTPGAQLIYAILHITD